MIRNREYREIGASNAHLPQVGSGWRDAAACAAKRWLARWFSWAIIHHKSSEESAFSSDWWLISAGIVTAIGSAVFATLMIGHNSFSNIPNGSEYKGVFARALRARSHQSQVHGNNPNRRSIDYRSIDYGITNSISIDDVGEIAQHNTYTSNLNGSAAPAGIDTNKSYVLLFVHKEAALLKSDRSFYVAKRGTMLPGVGKVLSIERLGDRWILMTPTRIFREVKNNLP